MVLKTLQAIRLVTWRKHQLLDFLHEFVAGRPITEPDSESGFLIGRSPVNSWRKFLADRARDKADTLQGF